MQRRDFLAAAAAASWAAAELRAAEQPVRVGVVGTGSRGTSLMRALLDQPGVEVPAVCDVDDNAAARAQQLVVDSGRAKPEAYARGAEDFRRMFQRNDLDGVILATPWQWHAPMMLAALEAGKAAAVEVPAAVTVDECWALVEAAEKTGVSATMLENWVYRREPLAVLNIARAGLLGEVVHCESGYGHDVRSGKFDARRANKGELAWRGEHSVTRNGNLYPTHQFAPVAMLMDINHGAPSNRSSPWPASPGMNQYARDIWAPITPAPNAAMRTATARPSCSSSRTAAPP